MEDPSYYVGLIRKKITEVNGESTRLRAEIDQQSRDTSQNTQLERRYETLIKNKETLEGELADYNLALDKVRTSTDPAVSFLLISPLQFSHLTHSTMLNNFLGCIIPGFCV